MAKLPIQMVHRLLGPCELVRVEGTTWIISHRATGNLFRVPPTRRSQYSAATMASSVDLEAVSSITANSSNEASSHPPSRQLSSHDAEEPRIKLHANVVSMQPATCDLLSLSPRLLRRAIHSMKEGLSPPNIPARAFAIGAKELDAHFHVLLEGVKDGGAVTVLRGAYGQGKTFSLNLLKESALDAGFLVASTEIDACEIRLDKPQQVYRSLVRNLQYPDGSPTGIETLAGKVNLLLKSEVLNGSSGCFAAAASDWLLKRVDCEPLSWLLSDPQVMQKAPLLKLLGGDGDVNVRLARGEHVSWGSSQIWPGMRYSTQGDFGSYLLSGLGLCARLIGYRGLIIILDEMEKWQDLNWMQQTKAGNFLGGLMWAATAGEDIRKCWSGYDSYIWSRSKCFHSEKLSHSRTAGGSPFTTKKRCYIGVGIAMTPRGQRGPEYTWSDFAPFTTLDLPEFNKAALERYFAKMLPVYAHAHRLECPVPDPVRCDAIRRWQSSADRSARAGVTAVFGALEEWRETL